MKTLQSAVVAPRAGVTFSRENILLLILKLRTFIALFLIVGFFAFTVPGFLSGGSMVIMIKHIAINAFLDTMSFSRNYWISVISSGSRDSFSVLRWERFPFMRKN